MKIFQCIISPSFRQPVTFSLKTLARESSFKISTASKRCFNINSALGVSFSPHANNSKYHTTCYARKEIQDDLSHSMPKKRLRKKKGKELKDESKEQTLSAVAYSSAKEYKMQDLVKGIEKQEEYQCLPLPKDAGNDLHLCPKDTLSEPLSHIYIFSKGSVVFWNIAESKQREFLSFLKPYEIKSYDETLIEDEKEDLDYVFSEEETGFYDDCVLLNSKTDSDLQMYTFSNSLAQSVKLGMLEAALEKHCNSIEWVIEKMDGGEQIKMPRKEIRAKEGKLISLSYTINQSSNLLHPPDFYWNRKDLEILYERTCNYLDIPSRTKTMNERISDCSKLVDKLVNDMKDKDHIRLEWMIIFLIMIEVIFESVHYLERH